MNKLLIAVALCAALAACKKPDATTTPTTTPPADGAAAPAAAAPAAAAGDAASAVAGMPKECEDYINRAKACFAKANPAAAAAFQAGLDQSKAQWATMTDKAGLVQACKAINDQFATMAAQLKCE